MRDTRGQFATLLFALLGGLVGAIATVVIAFAASHDTDGLEGLGQFVFGLFLAVGVAFGGAAIAVFLGLRRLRISRAGRTAWLVLLLIPASAFLAGAIDGAITTGPMPLLLLYPGAPLVARWLATLGRRGSAAQEPPAGPAAG